MYFPLRQRQITPPFILSLTHSPSSVTHSSVTIKNPLFKPLMTYFFVKSARPSKSVFMMTVFILQTVESCQKTNKVTKDFLLGRSETQNQDPKQPIPRQALPAFHGSPVWSASYGWLLHFPNLSRDRKSTRLNSSH